MLHPNTDRMIIRLTCNMIRAVYIEFVYIMMNGLSYRSKRRATLNREGSHDPANMDTSKVKHVQTGTKLVGAKECDFYC